MLEEYRGLLPYKNEGTTGQHNQTEHSASLNKPSDVTQRDADSEFVLF